MFSKMTNFIENRAILAYYDGPEVIEATDRIGGSYIGMSLDSQDASFKFIVVGVSEEQLLGFRRGEVKLRNLILESSKYGWYVCETDDLEAPIPLQEQGDEEIPDSMLPDENYLLRDARDIPNSAMGRALAQSNFAVHLKIEPLDKLQTNRLRVKDYNDLVASLNSLIIKAGKSDSSDQDRLELDIVTTAAPGSVEVMLEASMPDSDLFAPHRSLVQAMQSIDSAMDQALASGDIGQQADSHDRDFRKKYLELLKVLERGAVDFQYSWAEPRFEDGNSTRIPLTTTKALVQSIKARAKDIMDKRERIIEGAFVRFNQQRGTWGLETDEGNLVVGSIDRLNNPSQLNGLVVGDRYTFECLETLTYQQAWKDENPSLILHRFSEVEEANTDGQSD